MKQWIFSSWLNGLFMGRQLITSIGYGMQFMFYVSWFLVGYIRVMGPNIWIHFLVHQLPWKYVCQGYFWWVSSARLDRDYMLAYWQMSLMENLRNYGYRGWLGWMKIAARNGHENSMIVVDVFLRPLPIVAIHSMRSFDLEHVTDSIGLLCVLLGCQIHRPINQCRFISMSLMRDVCPDDKLISTICICFAYLYPTFPDDPSDENFTEIDLFGSLSSMRNLTSSTLT